MLEEDGPEIVNVKKTDKILVDVISRLDYDEDINIRNINDHLSTKALAKLFTCYVRKTSGSK